MDISELRQSISALLQVVRVLPGADKAEPYLDDAVTALDQGRAFAAYSKVANTASSILDLSPHEPPRRAIASIAYLAYEYCVNKQTPGKADFTPSRDKMHAAAQPFGGPLPIGSALIALHDFLHPAGPNEVAGGVAPEEDAEVGANGTIERPGPGDTGPRQSSIEPIFKEAFSRPLTRRLSDQLYEWRDGNAQSSTARVDAFERALRRVLKAGESGRQFGSLAALEADLQAVRDDLALLSVPDTPYDLLDRARIARGLAQIDFGGADSTQYQAGRRAWLAAAFWNSQLTASWATNQEQFVYDVLGYLTAVQAEVRYATHQEQVLLLLRVSHLICRIASSDALVSKNFYEKFGNIQSWVRYTAGTVLAITGPGRVPPSRINSDPRFTSDATSERDRDEFGSVLLPSWRSPEEREAACAILLELASWEHDGAARLVRSILQSNEAEIEVWLSALRDVMERAAKVKVLRPNPWASPGGTKTITADIHALAVLASDVIHRTFPSIEGVISLNGTSFSRRRVPTFVCSAEFGPLGLFKADARDRIAREADNFNQFAQRLHPRYRASRSDKSIATISEPDDRIEFVGGLLTSYVFTEREAPRSFNDWFKEAALDDALTLTNELFGEALRPWYDHATLGTVDILAEYELFTRGGLDRLVAGLDGRGDLSATRESIDWLDRIVSWVDGDLHDRDDAVATLAARLQLCETLRSVTHGDLHMDNILVLGKPGAEYPCLIDFETTGRAHLLRDFSRFVGALLFRTNEWTPEEVVMLRAGFPDVMTSGVRSDLGGESQRVLKVLSAIAAVWQLYLAHWRRGAEPSVLELTASLVCSFLPFARYPDTSATAADLALTMSAELINRLEAQMG